MPGWSRSYLNPLLITALEEGRTFAQWLDGRVPGIDYARITADQSTRSSILAIGREPGTGVRHQHEENSETAEEFGVAIVKFHEDNGIGATHPDVPRPSFSQAVHALHCRRTPEGFPVRALIATEHERVWRLTEDFGRLHRALAVTDDGLFIERRAVLDLRSVDRAVSDGASVDEVRRTSERIGRHVRRRALDGGTPGGRRRFGWLPPDPRSGRKMNMRQDPDEWPVLREMIESALQGRGWNTIARDLDNRGVRTAAGKQWSGATVRQALTNPVMCGYRFLHGELVTDPATGRPVLGTWDAVATADEWRALVDISQRNGARRGTRLTSGSRPPEAPPEPLRKYLFSGFLRCGAAKGGRPCHSRMGGCARSTAHDPDNAVYTCAAMDCGGSARNTRAVDAYLTEVVLKLLAERNAVHPAPRADWEGQELLRQLVQERHLLVGAVADADSSAAVVDLSRRISGLEATRAEHLAAGAAHRPYRDPGQWPAMSLLERRAAVADVIDAVIVMPLRPGTSRRAPFDPHLLRVIPKQFSAG
ncbi:recombinase family protein [Streptomyces kunmingensis]|uniref:Recombinase family protein n=1 Tax=Streptomyces kunmingensis TaxID=68225 RepID=A0ABU6CGH7_9ACTN|nr:recombinase family protein [Streptomyces kunmingensis]MEB3963818.1 recombinase family protein [Streptomyces kunmingensis]